MRFRIFIPVALFLLTLASCSQDLQTGLVVKKGLILDGNQLVPAKPNAGNGTLDVVYNKSTKILTYTVKWNSLSGAPNAMHIHGSATAGFNAAIVQNITGYATAASGTLTGTLLVDGMVIKEIDLLNGGYYFDIHTALNSAGGEIRGQITFE